MKKIVLIWLIFASNLFAAGFFEEHSLIVFFTSTCPYCQKFAPVIKEWSDKNHVPLIAMALDNRSLPEFQDYQKADLELINTAFAGRNITYPATFISNNKQKLLYPVAFGALDKIELHQRLLQIQPIIQEYEDSLQ